jgi:hypothetical protein
MNVASNPSISTIRRNQKGRYSIAVNKDLFQSREAVHTFQELLADFDEYV